MTVDPVMENILTSCNAIAADRYRVEPFWYVLTGLVAAVSVMPVPPLPYSYAPIDEVPSVERSTPRWSNISLSRNSIVLSTSPFNNFSSNCDAGSTLIAFDPKKRLFTLTVSIEPPFKAKTGTISPSTILLSSMLPSNRIDASAEVPKISVSAGVIPMLSVLEKIL